jgi:two-component system response regulator
MKTSQEAKHTDKAIIEILLVEDSEKDIELTLHALRAERLGNDIHVARDGEEALAFLATSETQLAEGTGGMPKLILLDLKLPKVDGLQVLRQIKSNPITKIIPVVILTSSKEDQDMVNSYHLGVNSYLQTPVNFEQFRKMVKDLGLYWLLVNQLPSAAAQRSEQSKRV